MRKEIFVLIFLCAACGDLGSSQVDVQQTQTTAQATNADELNCQIDCDINEEGQVTNASKECSGSAPFVVAVQSMDQCDTFNEIAA